MSQAAHVPLACNMGVFTSGERLRHASLMQGLFSKKEEIRELPDGFAFRFSGDDATWQELAEYVSLERRCCPFLTFTLIRKGEASTLQLTGPEGVKAFLLSELGLG